MSEVRTPDFFETIKGWRSWTIRKHRGHYFLSSLFTTRNNPHRLWERPAREARCLPLSLTLRTINMLSRVVLGEKLRHDRIVPDLYCGCGLYCHKNPNDATRYLFSTFLRKFGHQYPTDPYNFPIVAVGRVENWGKIAEHTDKTTGILRGFRSQFSWPSAILLLVWSDIESIKDDIRRDLESYYRRPVRLLSTPPYRVILEADLFAEEAVAPNLHSFV